MKSTIIVISLLLMSSSSAYAIQCKSSVDHNDRGPGWWSWRLVEGRKCWFKKVGSMPPKSTLSWKREYVDPEITSSSRQEIKHTLTPIESTHTDQPVLDERHRPEIKIASLPAPPPEPVSIKIAEVRPSEALRTNNLMDPAGLYLNSPEQLLEIPSKIVEQKVPWIDSVKEEIKEVEVSKQSWKYLGVLFLITLVIAGYKIASGGLKIVPRRGKLYPEPFT